MCIRDSFVGVDVRHPRSCHQLFNDGVQSEHDVDQRCVVDFCGKAIDQVGEIGQDRLDLLRICYVGRHGLGRDRSTGCEQFGARCVDCGKIPDARKAVGAICDLVEVGKFLPGNRLAA